MVDYALLLDEPFDGNQLDGGSDLRSAQLLGYLPSLLDDDFYFKLRRLILAQLSASSNSNLLPRRGYC